MAKYLAALLVWLWPGVEREPEVWAGDARAAPAGCCSVAVPTGAFPGEVSLSGYVYEEAKLTASDGAQVDRFGFAAAIDGDSVLIGAFLDDDLGKDSGSAYIFEREEGGAGTWSEVAKLTASDAANNDRFGCSVALSAETAVVGARLGDSPLAQNSGAAYVFYRDPRATEIWSEVTRLTASDGALFDDFGASVAIDDDLAVVGARLNDAVRNDSGSAYIFERHRGGTDNWGEAAKLTPYDAAAHDLFGAAVAISGETIVVGAYHDKDLGIESGSAYVFERLSGPSGGWREVAKLVPSDGVDDQWFGYSVSISGDAAVVGAHDDTGSTPGAAYIFERDRGDTDSWGEVAKLTASDGENGDKFGISVAIHGDTALIGAFLDDDAGYHSGSAYLFQRRGGPGGGWMEVDKLVASDAAHGDTFGHSVDLAGSRMVVGSEYDDAVGSAYVFREATIFTDGFESGDASTWSGSVP